MNIFRNPDSSAPFEDTELRSQRISSEEASIEATEADCAVPLIVGVTGHRDLVPREIPRLRDLVKNSLQDLVRRFPHTPVQVMSTLAEGADILVAEEALKLDLPLIAAIREGYSYMKADKELINQYRFMHRIFAGAQRSLKVARDNEERREILKALGDVALQEHSEWILMHRKRPLKTKIR